MAVIAYLSANPLHATAFVFGAYLALAGIGWVDCWWVMRRVRG